MAMMSDDIDYIDNIDPRFGGLRGWKTINTDGFLEEATEEESKAEMLKEKINQLIFLFKKLENEVGAEPFDDRDS